MPEAEAVATTCWASALPTPGAMALPSDMLAGAWMACAGTLLPSGRVGSGRSPAVAVGELTPSRLAVQAADSSAIGTSAVAWCRRPNRFADIELSPTGIPTSPPDVPRTQRVVPRTSYAVVGDGAPESQPSRYGMTVPVP